MKKTELILIIIANVTLAMMMFQIPLGGAFAILSLSSLSLIYMYFGFALFNSIRFREIFQKESYKGISKKRIIGGVGAGFALSVSSIGVLFKFLSWPGASINLIVGIIALIIVAVISLIKMQKTADKYYSNILKRVIGFGVTCILLLTIPTKTWLSWKYPNNPEYVQSLLDSREDTGNQELQQKADEEWEKMDKEKDFKQE